MNKLWNGIKTLITTILIVFLASNHQNIFYKFFHLVNINDKNLEKLILSALVTFLILVVELILTWVMSKLISNFSKLKITTEVLFNNRSIEEFHFNPDNNHYNTESFIVEFNIFPKGKLTLRLLKFLNLKVKVFFNPDVIDIDTENNPYFDNVTDIIINSDGSIEFFLLKEYKIEALRHSSFKRNMNILIIPKRLYNDTSNLSFSLYSNVFGYNVRHICIFKPKEIKVICNGGG